MKKKKNKRSHSRSKRVIKKGRTKLKRLAAKRRLMRQHRKNRK